MTDAIIHIRWLLEEVHLTTSHIIVLLQHENRIKHWPLGLLQFVSNRMKSNSIFKTFLSSPQDQTVSQWRVSVLMGRITTPRTSHTCTHQETSYRRSLQWRHNGLDCVSSHHCLHNRLFKRRSKKTSKLCVTGLCAGNSPVTGDFPVQMASNAENASIWWRHHDMCFTNYSNR